ncbi:DUF6155 family protein [Labilibacter marinus]|uniref:DUF6155 family protein n=1 Tax=Labilibacter marinus TaxID=1477105 RepID=UPI00082D2FBA|nr:DUF6155 family protein [Labilibacter marinus]
MGLREVKSELNKLDKADLIKHISELYKIYKPVKEYFDFYVNPKEEEILEKYKEKVREGFYPKRGFALKLSISRTAINEFKKLGTSKEALSDLLIYYVECGVEFTNDFGDIDENFYSSIENAFGKALQIMSKEGILAKFEDRAYEIVENAQNIGWGFHDYLADVYSEYYE